MLKSILTAFIEAVYVYMVLVFPLAVWYRKAQKQEAQSRRKQKYYKKCPQCGANLDPSERCNCQTKEKKR